MRASGHASFLPVRRWTTSAPLVVLLLLMNLVAQAGDTSTAAKSAEVVERWNLQPWVDAAKGFQGEIELTGSFPVDAVAIRYRYGSGEIRTARVVQTFSDRHTVAFEAPAEKEPIAGHLELWVETGDATSGRYIVPVGSKHEFDITGAAAELLLYPLADDRALIRYIPCCNIYGGLLVARRFPFNLSETDDGLPENLLSDFIVLEPDQMTEATAGLYFQFTYDPAKLPSGDESRVGLYNLVGSAWREVFTYDTDSDNNTVSFHCPEGGTFVLAEKPAAGN